MSERTTMNRLRSTLNSVNVNKEKMMVYEENNCIDCKNSNGELCHVQLATIVKLKDSTRKLLCLLENIQSKTHSKNLNPNNHQSTESIKQTDNKNDVLSVTDVIGANTIMRLESRAKNLDSIYIENEEDDCSIYKRLTRKCLCLNQSKYNDFIIHFNEDTKHFTSNFGEIIKNMRILKKFLYMGGSYTEHALMFLNEGLSDSLPHEKVEISQACSYADICNVFEDHSIVTFCISWPYKYEYYKDSTIQALATEVLHKLALLEEGRRYLKFSSKITNDIKKVLRKKSSKLDFDTLENLNATLNLLHPPISQNVNVTYYGKPIDEGIGNKTVKALVQYRQCMTIDEVLTHLTLLQHLSNNDGGKSELIMYLPTILRLFMRLLVQYDNSEMNIIVTKILNNIISSNMVKDKELEAPKIGITADTVTKFQNTFSHVDVKNEIVQMQPKKYNKKVNKSKTGTVAASKRKVGGWENSSLLNRSKKYTEADSRYSVIVVPIEE